MGLSYSEFKRKAREHQVKFREEILCVEYNKYPNVLNFSDARKGLVFYEGFREEILAELKKPVPKTSSAPSGQMLTNLLRSEHIPYNVFFPMNKDLNGCKDLFNHILGKEEILRIEDIKIEYHPEPIENYLSDHTAFDVYISYTNTDNKECGIGIEVKYTEKEYALKEGTSEYAHVKDEHGNTRLFGPYFNATNNSRYFKEEVTHDILVTNKFRQIWRNHILGASMVQRGDIEQFTSITIYPEANIHFHNDAMPEYYELLSETGKDTFIPLTYEELFNLMDKFLNVENGKEWNMYLKQRYLF